MSETWIINDTFTAPTNTPYTINFVSNNQSFTSIRYGQVGTANIFALLYDSTVAWAGGAWYNEAYRTVVFSTSPTGDLLTWLEANVVKQEEPVPQNLLISTINSVPYILQSGTNVLTKTATQYTITPTLTNVTADASNPSMIYEGATATLTFTANSGYALPDSVTVSGASYVWTKSTGTLVLSNATGDVSVTIVGGAITDLTGLTWTGNNPVSVASGENTFNVNYGIICNDSTYNINDGTQLKIFGTSEFNPGPGETLNIGYITINTSNYYVFGGQFYQSNGRIYESDYSTSWPASCNKTSTYSSAISVTSIVFTGGTDATNSTLISWLQANGTLH